jgi:hypothetical protein
MTIKREYFQRTLYLYYDFIYNTTTTNIFLKDKLTFFPQNRT